MAATAQAAVGVQTKNERLTVQQPDIVRGRLKVTNEDGHTEQLKDPELFVVYGNRLYPLHQLTAGPSVGWSQVVTGYKPDPRNPYLVCHQRRAMQNQQTEGDSVNHDT
jgi:hypothetical protein